MGPLLGLKILLALRVPLHFVAAIRSVPATAA